MHESRAVAGPFRRVPRVLPLLVAALAAGCDFSWNARSDDGKVRVEASGGSALALAGPDRAGGLHPPVRRDRPVVLRFNAPVDPASARGAFRAVDETRGDDPVPLSVEVTGREVRLRPAAPAGLRAGARLRISVAGQPSLRALRGAAGETLEEDVVVRLDVVPTRGGDREPPVLAGSIPADGAAEVDPAAAVVLRFSEPVESPAGADGLVPPRALRMEASGEPVPFRVVQDRSHRELALVPEGGLPQGAEVVVRVGPGLRDAAGNGVARAGVVRFATRRAAEPVAAWVVEDFEDGSGEDRGGTTVPWGDPLAPRLLVGVIEPLPLEVAAGARARPLPLDPRGGRMRIHVPVEDLGEERRLLKGVFLPGMPGGVRGEFLGLEVRAAPAPALLGLDDPAADALPWRALAEYVDPLPARAAPAGWSIPFRRPCFHDGAVGLLLEVSWTGTTGPVTLRASEGSRPRLSRRAADGVATEGTLAPDLRFDAVGDRPVALSRWIDSGADAPRWGSPVVRPGNGGAVVLLQGAPPDAEGTGPDAAAASPWTDDASSLAGFRWIRFRVVFDTSLGGVPAEIDDLAIPFRR